MFLRVDYGLSCLLQIVPGPLFNASTANILSYTVLLDHREHGNIRQHRMVNAGRL